MADWQTCTYIVLALAGLGVPMLLAALKFSLRPGQDVVGLQETRAAIVASLMLASSLIAMNILTGLWGVQQAVEKADYSALVLVVPALFVLSTAIVGYVAMDARYRILFRSAAEPDPSASSRILSLTTELAKVLGLRHIPTVLVDPRIPSPLCYGRSAAHSTIRIPADFDAICREATYNNAARADLLARFVLAHELSHVRHGDCAALSWLSLFYTDLKLSLLLNVLGVLASSLFFSEGDFIRRMGTMLLFTAIAMPFLRWTISEVARYRELLADARSAQAVGSEPTRQLLLGPTAEAPGAIEFLITAFSIRSRQLRPSRVLRLLGLALPSAALGWSDGRGSKVAFRQWTRLHRILSDLHPSLTVRHNALMNGSTAGNSEGIPSLVSVVQSDLCAAFAFATALTCLHLSPLPSASRPVALHVLAGLLLLASVSLPALGASSAARTSSWRCLGGTRHILPLARRCAIGGMLGLLLLVAVMAASTSLLAEPSGAAGNIWGPAVLYIFCRILGLGFAMLLSWIAGLTGGEYLHTQLMENIPAFLPAALVAAAMIAPALLVLGITAFALGTFAGCVILNYAMTLLEVADHLNRAVALRIGPIVVYLEGPAYRKWGVVFFIVVFAVPFACSTWVAGAVWHVILTPVEQAQDLTNVGIVTLLGAVVYCVGASALCMRIARTARTSNFSFLLTTHRFLAILDCTGTVVSDVMKCALIESIVKRQNPQGLFPHRAHSPFVFVSANYYACLSLSKVGWAIPNAEAVSQWIARCRCAGGGYSYRPGGIQRLEATYYALAVLKVVGQQASRSSEDLDWISGLQIANNGILDPNSKERPAKQTWYGVMAFELLGGLSTMDLGSVAGVCKSVLDRDRAGLWDVLYASEALRTLGAFGEDLKREVFDRHACQMIALATKMPIHANLAWIEGFCRLLRLTESVAPDQCRSALASIGDRTARAFQHYLNSDRIPGGHP